MKKILVVLLSVVFLFSILPIGVFATSAKTNVVPEGYTAIYDVVDLYCIRYDLTGKYILMNDIDLTEATANGGDWDFDGRGWNPIGSNDVYSNGKFTGEFNGNGYSIIGMRIEFDAYNNQPSGTGAYLYLGLFANNAGLIYNLKMQNVNIKINRQSSYDYLYTGAICGTNNGTISECFSDGNISTPCDYIGGITGSNADKGIIEKCYNKANVTAGSTDNSNRNVGGIAGRSNGTVNNCYNTGNITSKCSTIYVGGIVGINYNKIINCYNAGVTTSGSSTGYGISCNNGSSSKIEKSYYLRGTGLDATGSTVLNVAQMKIPALFNGFDFDTVWTMSGDPDYPYPELQCFATPEKTFNAEDLVFVKKTLFTSDNYVSEADINEDGNLDILDLVNVKEILLEA